MSSLKNSLKTAAKKLKFNRQTDVVSKELIKGKQLMVIGLVLLIAAFLLMGYNIWSEHRAERASDKAAVELQEILLGLQDIDYINYHDVPDMEMPVQMVAGQNYIGLLSFPSLGLMLPVIDEWSYPSLKLAPCRYTGSAYDGTLVIAGHNYRTHFNRIKTLQTGDEVIFTDMAGNEFKYYVKFTEILQKDKVAEMTGGIMESDWEKSASSNFVKPNEWDLTLFTCTYGGHTRLAVRCVQTIDESM